MFGSVCTRPGQEGAPTPGEQSESDAKERLRWTYRLEGARGWTILARLPLRAMSSESLVTPPQRAYTQHVSCSYHCPGLCMWMSKNACGLGAKSWSSKASRSERTTGDSSSGKAVGLPANCNTCQVGQQRLHTRSAEKLSECCRSALDLNCLSRGAFSFENTRR